MKIAWYNMLYYKLAKDCNFCLYNTLWSTTVETKMLPIKRDLFINVPNIEKEITLFR